MKNAFKGMIAALVSSLLVALLFAYIFRIPIPFGGYIGPLGDVSSYDISMIDVVKSVIVAWVFYGIFGGFIILPITGAVTGFLVGKKYDDSNDKTKFILVWSAFVGSIPVIILSILDYLIGPW